MERETETGEERKPRNTDSENADMDPKADHSAADDKSVSVEKESFGSKLKKFFSRQHLVRTIILALALVSVVVGAITFFSSLSPKSIARKYCIAENDDDIATMAKYLAYDYKEYLMRDYRNEESFYKAMSDELGEDIASWNDYCKVSLKMRKEDREDAFGKYKITAG